MGIALKRTSDSVPQLEIDGTLHPVTVRVNRRARRLIVRLDQKGRIVVVAPSQRAVRKAIAFAEEQKAWITKQLRALPAPLPFRDQAVIPLRNVPHRLVHRPEARGGVWCTPAETPDMLSTIAVTGRPEFFERRLTDWLKRTAKDDLTERCLVHASALDLGPTKITVRDSTTRWGSCSYSGTLSFSWRLIFAPAFVLDYVAAHETAHRVHMSHCKAFWRVVDGLTSRRDEAETWLSDKGNDLHLIGMSDSR